MNFKLPIENDDPSAVFVRRIFTIWHSLSSRSICLVCSYRLGPGITLTPLRTVLYSMNLRFAKIKACSRFGDVIIPMNNCRPNAGNRNLDGSIEGYVLTGLSKNNESSIEGRVQWPFVSLHILTSINISLNYSGHTDIYFFWHTTEHNAQSYTEFSEDNSEIFDELWFGRLIGVNFLHRPFYAPLHNEGQLAPN
jgi:hypothetical protein